MPIAAWRRCGVEVWEGGDQDLPVDAHRHWRAHTQAAAAASGGDQGAEPLPPPQFAPHVAHFLVDGVEQPLWANSLEFYVDGSEGSAAGGDGSCTCFGLVRLVLTHQSACALFGLAA